MPLLRASSSDLPWAVMHLHRGGELKESWGDIILQWEAHVVFGKILVIECQWEMGLWLCVETLPLHLWCLSAALGIFGGVEVSAFPVLCINSNMRKRNQLCGWNSSLVWVLPEVEQSMGGGVWTWWQQGLAVSSWVLLLGNVGGTQEIRNTQTRRLTGTHAPFCDGGMVEGTRIILPENQSWRCVGTGCSEIKHLNVTLHVAL